MSLNSLVKERYKKIENLLHDKLQEKGLVSLIQHYEKEMFIGVDLYEHIEKYKLEYIVDKDEDLLETVNFWRHISGNDINIIFIRFYEVNLHYDMISWNAKLTMENIIELEDKLDWDKLTMNNNITKEIYLKFQHKFNIKYINVKTVGENFFIENKDLEELDWCHISDQCHDFSNNFFEACKNKLYWWRISRWNKNINDEFLHLFHDKIDWCDLIEFNESENIENGFEILVQYKEFIKYKPFIKNYNYHLTYTQPQGNELATYETLLQIFSEEELNQ